MMPKHDLQDLAALVEQAQRDRRDFGPIYESYVDLIYRYCYRRLGSHEAAEDATSEVFCRAISALGTYRGRSFRSWLFAIAHNTVIDALRQRRADQRISTPLDVPDTELSPEELVLAHEQRQSLDEDIKRLSPDQQAVIQLRRAGLTGAEIAHVLGRRHGAVKALQFRALARLRELVQEHAVAEECRHG